MRDRHLDSLAEPFKQLAIELLARFVEAGLAVMIVETRRTEAQHEEDVASGHSWIKRSKHQDGLAIDVAPFAIYIAHGDKKLNWDASDPTWGFMGSIGKLLGLGWGGDWRQRDLGHFELSTPTPTTHVASLPSSSEQSPPEPSA